MTRNRTLHRISLAALSAALLTFTLAQTAQADPGGRWRHADHGRWGRHDSRIVYRAGYRGGPGPVFAGLVGGFVLGAMTHPHPVVVRERVVYVPAPDYRYDGGYVPPAPSYRDDSGYAPPAPSSRDDSGYAPPAPSSRDDSGYAPQSPSYRQDRNVAPPAPTYRFEDSSGERWWDTLQEAHQAAFDRDGPRKIKVVDAHTNRVVDTLYWSRDHFISDSGQFQDDIGQQRNDDNGQ